MGKFFVGVRNEVTSQYKYKGDTFVSILKDMTREERARALLAVAKRYGELKRAGKVKPPRSER